VRAPLGRASRSFRSISARITPSTSTASRATTASVPSSPREGSSCRRGRLDDPTDADTIGGLANSKNELALALIREQGVEAYEGSIRYVNAVRAAGLGCAVVSASANAREVLEAAGIAHLFDERLDGIDAERMQLKGKPAPDTFLAAARTLWVFPAEAAVFENALAGVSAARAGSFGYVVGVDRVGRAQALRRHGADIVVSDLAELLRSR